MVRVGVWTSPSLVHHRPLPHHALFPVRSVLTDASSQSFEFFVVTSPPPASGGGDPADAAPRTHALLRTSLRKHLAAAGLSAEATVTLEYAPALPAPTSAGSHPTDDWIVALDGECGLALAGLASGSLDVFSSSAGGGLVRAASCPAHSGALTSVHGLEAGCGGVAAGSRALLTSGKDGVARLWALGPAPSLPSRGKQGGAPASLLLAPVASLSGATAGLTAARLDPSGALAAGGDDNGVVLVWSAFDAAAAAVHIAPPSAAAAGGAAALRGGKRGRAASGDEEATPTASRAPIASSTSAVGSSGSGVDASHASGPVTGVAWVSAGSFASCGWDGSVRVWDVEGGRAASAGPPSASAAALTPLVRLACAKAATSISASPLGSLLATAHADHSVRVWDTRGRRAAPAAAFGGKAGSAQQSRPDGLTGALSQGEGWLTSVAWCPRSSHHVAAAGMDGAVCLWDVRATAAPLFQVHTHASRALAVK